MAFRFQRFSTRILALLLGLLFATLASTYLFVSHASEANAIKHAEENLGVAVRVFDEATRQRIEALTAAARIMAEDYVFKTVLADPKLFAVLGPRS